MKKRGIFASVLLLAALFLLLPGCSREAEGRQVDSIKVLQGDGQVGLPAGRSVPSSCLSCWMWTACRFRVRKSGCRPPGIPIFRFRRSVSGRTPEVSCGFRSPPGRCSATTIWKSFPSERRTGRGAAVSSPASRSTAAGSRGPPAVRSTGRSRSASLMRTVFRSRGSRSTSAS